MTAPNRGIARAFELAMVVACVFAAPSAWAGQPTAATSCNASPQQCGRQAFQRGVEAYEHGDYATALEHFERAYEIRPHPAVALNLALCQDKLGLHAEALQRLDDALQDEQTTPSLRKHIQTERDRVARQVATIVVDTPGTNTSVSVDGQRLEGPSPSIRVNPGRHKVTIEVTGREAVQRELHVAPGETLRITLDQRREVVIVMPPGRKPKPQPSRQGLEPAWFCGAAGVTAVVGGLAIWSGLDTNGAYDDYVRDLPTLNQQQVNDRVEEGHGKETRTNVLWVATGVLAAGTAALGIWAVDWGPAKVEVEPAVSGVLLRGKF